MSSLIHFALRNQKLKAAFSNFKPPENNETKMSDIVSEHNGSLD